MAAPSHARADAMDKMRLLFPLTVTGSLGIFTRFPIIRAHPTIRAALAAFIQFAFIISAQSINVNGYM